MSSKEERDMAKVHDKFDKFLADFETTIISQKVDMATDLLRTLKDNPDAINSYSDISRFIEGLGAHWINNQNPKVSQFGFEALLIIAEAMQGRYKTYSGNVFNHAVIKLGDTKEAVRENAKHYLTKTVESGAHNPNSVLEKLITVLVNKNKDMSQEAQKLILQIIQYHMQTDKKKSLSATMLSDMLEVEVGCLSNNLREEATVIILLLTQLIGRVKVIERLEKAKMRASSHMTKKLSSLIDEIRSLPMAQLDGSAVVEEDQVDQHVQKTKKIPVSTPKPKPKLTSAGSKSGKGVIRSKLGEGEKYALYSGPVGEADEAWFLASFLDTPPIVILSHRELEDMLKEMTTTLKSSSDNWTDKVKAFKKLRSLIINKEYTQEIINFIRTVSLQYVLALKDLRSQVAREACLTFAFFCQEFKHKLDTHSYEVMLLQLLQNVASGSRVVATASYIAVKFLIKNVTYSRVLSTMLQVQNYHKEKGSLTAVCEFVELILNTWPVSRLEQNIPVLQELIRQGTGEIVTEARMAARRAYWAFNSIFPEHGEALLNSMDATSRKSLLTSDKVSGAPLTQPKRTATSIPKAVAYVRPDAAGTRKQPNISPSIRSNSAIDLQAVQRAKARQQYAAIARQKVGSGASLPRPNKKPDLPPLSGPISGTFAGERTGRTRNRVAGVSQSQPGSRSGSPSSRLGYQTYNMPDTNALMYQSRKTNPHSQGTSRETSPNRLGSKSSLTNLFVTKRSRLGQGRDRPPIQPSTPVMAQKMLAQSLEAENLPLAGENYDGDCADNIGHKMSPRKTNYRPFEDHSDDSDASSLCSERSFDSYRRTSDSYSWSGSQQRLYRDVWETGTKDIVEIIANCESIHWSDRKEGLVALQSYLQAGNTLNPSELKRVTDVFTRMFMDSHTKVFSLFLDTLNELILVHRADLNSWLYVLLTRLLNKLGADLLGSIQNKILKSLDVVRESFPPELQMSSVLRFLTDPTQTPNLRVKTAALTFITKLAAITDPSQAFPPPSPGHTRDPVQAALHKMIGWTMGDSIKQGNELRRAAQEAILALFNLNTPQVTLRLASLPQEYQEAAATLLRGRVRRGSSSSGGGTTTSSPPSPSPRLASPAPTSQRHLSRAHDSDILNPEEIYRSLRKTTAEIQNYTYETGTEKPPDKDNTTSKDSGISQLSGIEALEENMEELSLQSGPSNNTTTTANRVLTVRDCNGVDMADGTAQGDGLLDEHEAMRKIVEALKSPPDSDNGENISIMSETEKRASLGQLARMIRESSVTVLQENFKALLRILLGNLALDLNTRDVQTRILVLTALTELIRKRAMTEHFNHYVELLILKVLNSYKDTSKEVMRHAEVCANTIAFSLAPPMIIRVLAPLIQTGEYPLNLAAIKMLTKLVDFCGRDPVFKYLPDLMPGLIQAYDNQESTVRKSAVFCMVSLHAAIGEEDLKPHLEALNGSKLKLLHLYIRRAQQGSSTPTSPRNHPQTSSS